MSERAWNILQPLIGYCTEPLPATGPSGELLYIIHVMETIDCLDERRSEVSRNSATNRISSVWRHAFDYSKMQGKHIFRLPLESGSDLLVSEEFQSLCERENLIGLTFKELPLVDEQA